MVLTRLLGDLPWLTQKVSRTRISTIDMILILLVFDSTYIHAGETVRKDDAELNPGNYYLDGKSSTHALSYVF